MLKTITYITDPIEIAALTEKWVKQLEVDKNSFVVSPRTKTLLNSFYQESGHGKITALHPKLAKLYATLHYGLKKRCDCCEVNDTAFYSYKSNCYCEFCAEWLKVELERFPFKSMSPIKEEVGRTVFGEHVIRWLELEYDKLFREIPTVTRNATSELQIISNKVNLLLEEHKRQNSRFFGD